MRDNRTFAVRRKRATATDVAGLELVPVDGRPVAPFAPGAHVEITLRRPGSPPVARPYSICNGPGETEALILGVKREAASRGGSALVHDHLRVGDTLEVSAPREHFGLNDDAGFHLLLAGGIGMTPLLAMAQALQARGADYAFHCFVRSDEHLPFRDRLDNGLAAARVHLHAGLPVDATRAALRSALAGPRARDHAYACGPAAFMDAVAEIAKPDWGTSRVHFERFQAATRDGRQDDAAFEVALARSGLVCTVQPGESIVQALAFAGHDVAVSCEQGVCGTCLTGVRDGVPDHRDDYLDDRERAAGTQMLPCVSRSLSARLVLDL